MKKNGDLLERIIDVIFLHGRKGLKLRGHSENMEEDDVNHERFLDFLKLLERYDNKVEDHLQNFESEHKTLRNSKKVKKWDRGSKITFLSHNTQKKLIKIIGDQITEATVLRIKNFLTWFLIVDS